MRIMLQFGRGIMAHAPRSNLHIIGGYAKSGYNAKKLGSKRVDFRIKCCSMADIKISHVTPRHFYEAVQLLRTVPYSLRFSDNSITIQFDRDFTLDFARLEHLGAFLRELEHSSVPVDLKEFIKTYRGQPGRQFFKRRY